ncbi:TetR/AcrR family transcriptional regulator [Lipingzhangella rawalii]|uniref:TetR/AcrR family transcriptional regulator n=1 Tax=Lipingzhangella rawalii TaxID=2055835 RepID=UPI00389967C2
MSRNNAGLSTEAIVTEALRIIDGQGLRRLTMRRLGDALNVEAMAIYHHFPLGKEQLFDAIVAHITDVDDTPRSASEPASHDAPAEPDPRSWRERLHDWAEAYRAALLDHSGALALLINRRADTPAALRSLETHYAAFAEAGLAPDTIPRAAAALNAYVTGAVIREVRTQSPASPDRVAPETVDGRYPHVARLAPTEGEDHDQSFRWGLEALLRGLVGSTHPTDRA